MSSKETKPKSDQHKQKKSELLIISDSDTFSNTNSLQNNFTNFRQFLNKMRQKKQKIEKIKCSEEHMNNLREKFYQTALSLIGTPYSKKYLKTNPLYKGNLFLDCCGLVRHSFNLLKKEFGFELGWPNQCYQFDILPDEKLKLKDLKKGDLIFYRARFYPDMQMKKQIHNMVHVEIYSGEGQKTIGSRHDGFVKIHNSFQFTSNRYYNIKYYFKSIDTWLKGIHKSFCLRHKWYTDQVININTKLTKYSAFYNAQEKMDDDKENDNNNMNYCMSASEEEENEIKDNYNDNDNDNNNKDNNKKEEDIDNKNEKNEENIKNINEKNEDDKNVS